jgi:RNA polymerase sigma-70 factor (ECF subfamily)
MRDPRPFEAMVLETEGKLRAHIAGIGVGRHAVDDIAQETYLAAWRQGIPDGIEPVRWLKGIARNKAIDAIRSASPRRRAIVDLALAAAPAAEGADPSSVAALRQCMQRLAPADHDLLHRRYHDEETSESIAQASGGSPSSVRKHLIRLREALEKCIARTLAGGHP